MDGSTFRLTLLTVALVTFGACSGATPEEAGSGGGSAASPLAVAAPAVVAGAGEVVFKGLPVKFAVPDGWTVTQNDGTEAGALIVLQEKVTEERKPTICLWLGTYDEKVASELGVTRGVLKVRMAVTGVDKGAADTEFAADMMGSIQATTTNTFLDFKAAGSPVVATVMSSSQENNAKMPFSISAAATDRSFGRVKAIADGLATQILRSLGANAGK